MGKSLKEIAQELKDSNKKVQLIYGFNGVGKTRLSREFKLLIDPKNSDSEQEENTGVKIIYYNAFTEDLFYWDNDLHGKTKRKLKIHHNNFTKWVLAEQGQEPNIIANFQRYTNEKLSPRFNEEYEDTDTTGNKFTVDAYSEVTFSIERGGDDSIRNVKVSKGEESNFIWCVFLSLLEQVVEVLNTSEARNRETGQFDRLEYVFIDDPVSSLDDNLLIELAVNIATLIKSSQSNLKFILTTHNPLFYNVLHNELSNRNKEYGYRGQKDFKTHRLEKLEDGTFTLEEQPNDSPFSYHLYLFSVLRKSIESGDIQKYHFSLLRNILEKTSTFLGYKQWGELIPGDTEDERAPYIRRILNFSSHSKHSGEEVPVVTPDDKRVLRYLVENISDQYNFKSFPPEEK